MSYNNYYNSYNCTPYNAASNSCKKKCQCKCSKCCDQCDQPCLIPFPLPPVCPTISYITSLPIAAVIPNSTSPTTIGPITPITTFSTAPIINSGATNTAYFNFCQNGVVNPPIINNINNTITLNTLNGQFNIPSAGRYLISGSIGFVESSAGTGANTGTREFYIYKVDGTTGSITLLAEDSRNAVVTGNTYVSITTVADLVANDKIYFAASQSNIVGASAISTTTDGRFAVSRLC